MPAITEPNVLKPYHYQLIDAVWRICTPLTRVFIG